MRTSSIQDDFNHCFVRGVSFIRVFECNSVYKCMGLHYPNFQLSEHTQVPMRLDKRGSTVNTFSVITIRLISGMQ